MGVLFQVKDVCKSYGATAILTDATVSCSENQKIGVIGRNGAGKSTLCKIITGKEEMDSGTITRSSELRLSYLEQHDPFNPDETVLGFLERYTGKEAWECGEMAAKFQLHYDLLEVKISTLPGGYQTRVKLTAMLLSDPNFLILDEPSNYLDLSTLILLENFLQEFRGGFLIVSHDREFLKRTCDHTLEIEHGRLTLYPGDIEEYFEFKEEQRNQKLAYNRTIEKKKEQLQEFIDRFKARASTATRAKSKMKQLARLKTIGIAHTLAEVKIRIPNVEDKAGVALSVQDLDIGYPDKKVASKISMDVDRGQKVAILGDNGQGKTTFLKTLAGDLAALAGNFKWGSGLKVAYYAQHVFSSLHPEDDVFSHLQREASLGVTTQEILDLAGCFLFRGDDVKKKIPVLSGGERARLCLAGILLTKSHVLLLDEPTNHLDFETVEALGSALKEFSGTVFFISHDRTFVNLLATNIIEVKDGRVSRYPGIYEDYVYHLESVARHEMADDSDGSGEEETRALPAASEQESENRKAEKKKIKADLTALKAQISKHESRIEHLTREKTQILKEMEKNPFHFSRERNEKLKTVTVKLEEAEAEWLGLQPQLEKLQKQLEE